VPGNNDFAHMHEVISRRFSGRHGDWPKPDLLLIDGGKGQLAAALDALEEKGVHIPAIGLAKRLEEIVVHKSRSGVVLDSNTLSLVAPSDPPLSSPMAAGSGVPSYRATQGFANSAVPDPQRGGFNESSAASGNQKTLSRVPEGLSEQESFLIDEARGTANHYLYITESEDFYIILLPQDSHIVKLLQRIRDESHRFAVSYHTVLKRQRQTASELEEIPGIGPATRKKLIRSFGSLRAVRQASLQQIAAVIGEAKAKLIRPDANAGQRP
jgi:excinuclease ABC subunit C